MGIYFLLIWVLPGLIMIWSSLSHHHWANSIFEMWQSARRPGPGFNTRLGLAMLGLTWVIGPLSIIALFLFDPHEHHPAVVLGVIFGSFFGPILIWRIVDAYRANSK
jgi:hypothetical protein